MGRFFKMFITIVFFEFLIFSIVFIIYAIAGDEKRDRMLEYYENQLEYQDLMKIDGKIIDIDYRFGRSKTTKVIFSIENDEGVKKLCLYKIGYHVDLYDSYINTNVEIYYDTKKFGNRWIEPIFFIKSGQIMS